MFVGAAIELIRRIWKEQELNWIDLIVIDTAHGHSKSSQNFIKDKNNKNIPVCVGNIATGHAQKLYNSGADIIKVGIGPVHLHYKNGCR